MSCAEKKTHDDSGFGTEQPRGYNLEEEELIPLEDDENGKGSPLLTKQIKGTMMKQRKRPQPHQMCNITNILDV